MEKVLAYYSFLLTIIAILEFFAILKSNKLLTNYEIEYSTLKVENDLIKENNNKLKKELDLQMQTNKVEAKIINKEKVAKPRGRKPKAKKEEK